MSSISTACLPSCSATAVQISGLARMESSFLLGFLDGILHFENEVGYADGEVLSKFNFNCMDACGGVSNGRFNHSHRSRQLNRFQRNKATRLDTAHLNAERNCRYRMMSTAMSAVQIWMRTALALVPIKVLILSRGRSLVSRDTFTWVISFLYRASKANAIKRG